MNPELGWWGLTGGGESFGSTLPDELEYMASSAVGYNVSPQIEKEGTGNHRAQEASVRTR